MFEKNFLDHLKENIDMKMLCNALGIQINNSGKICCPFHSDCNPSCHVYDNRLFCFGGCKKKNAIDLVQQITGMSFKDTVEFLKHKTKCDYQSNQNANKALPQKQSYPTTFDACLTNQQYVARWHCMQRIYEYLEPRTQEMILKGTVPLEIRKWAEKVRGYDAKHFLNLARAGDILFLDDARVLSKYVRDKESCWKDSGLFRDDGTLKWFSPIYPIIFPVWDIYTTEYHEKSLRLTSMRLRSISKQSTKECPKEVELLAPANFPASFGYMLQKSVFAKYPQRIADGYRDFTIMITESVTTACAAQQLFGGDPTLIVLSTGTIGTSSHFHNLNIFKNCKKLIIAFDHDVAGEKGVISVTEAARKIGIQNIGLCKFPEEFNDLNDYLIAQKNSI